MLPLAASVPPARGLAQGDITHALGMNADGGLSSWRSGPPATTQERTARTETALTAKWPDQCRSVRWPEI